jgi:hypothetical protein
MPFCPRCKSEYREGLRQCPDCRVELVERLAPEPSMPKDIELVEVFTAQTQVSAYAIKDRLEAAGIPAMLKSMDNTYYDGLMVGMYGYWGKVYVGKDDVEEARRVIEKALADLPDEPEEHDQANGGQGALKV